MKTNSRWRRSVLHFAGSNRASFVSSFEIRLARGVCCLERRQRFAGSVDRQQQWESRQIDIEALRVEHLGHKAAVGDRA
jgi:hypothetical protein